MNRGTASLLPKEHGAYAQLAFPLVSAVALSRPTINAMALATAAVCGFLAHEPLLVRLGRRGRARLRDCGPAAARRLLVLAIVGIFAVTLGLRGGEPGLIEACAVVGAGVILTAWLVSTKQEKTLPGELAVAATLCATSVPVALAGGLRPQAAVAVALAWWLAIALATLTVHAMLRRAKSRSAALAILTGVLAAGIAIGAVLLASRQGAWVLGLVPQTVVTLVVLTFRVAPKHLRRVGWSMVAAHLVALTVFVLGPRDPSGARSDDRVALQSCPTGSASRGDRDVAHARGARSAAQCARNEGPAG